LEEGADGKFGMDDVLKVVGGGLFFIAGLLSWWRLDVDGVTHSTTAFDYTLTGIVPYVIFVAIAILTVLDRTDSLRLPTAIVEPVVQLGAAAIAALLVIWRFVFSEIDDHGGASVGRGAGLYLALVGAIVALVGCIMTFRDVGVGDEEADDEAHDEAHDHTPPRTAPPWP
jgi:hypothetical protein